MKSALLFLFITCVVFSKNYCQGNAFEVERFDKKLELVISDPIFIPHFPVGLIYQDVDGDAFTNLSDRLLRIADGPFGFQLQLDNVIYSEVTKNSFSINHFNGSGDIFSIGPSLRAYWGPRNTASPFEYDLETFGNIHTKDFLDRRMSELTAVEGRGALRFYRYNSIFNISHTLTIDENGTPVWLAVSDRNAKKDIRNTAPVLADLCKLQLKNYKYKGSDIETTGYIAQEVQEVFPHLVKETEEGTLGVNYMGFNTLAVQAIKEQQEVIDKLESRIAQLEKLISE